MKLQKAAETCDWCRVQFGTHEPRVYSRDRIYHPDCARYMGVAKEEPCRPRDGTL